jgi:hypothetical protein
MAPDYASGNCADLAMSSHRACDTTHNRTFDAPFRRRRKRKYEKGSANDQTLHGFLPKICGCERKSRIISLGKLGSVPRVVCALVNVLGAVADIANKARLPATESWNFLGALLLAGYSLNMPSDWPAYR